MTKILLVGTFHYPDRFDIFSEKVQKQIEDYTDELGMFQPTKIAVEFPRKMQDVLDGFYKKCDAHEFDSDFNKETIYGNVERYGKAGFFSSLNEIVQIGFRLGKKLRHETIYGIDEEIEMSDELFGRIAPYADMSPFMEPMRRLTGKAQSIKELYAVHNSKEHMLFDHNMYLNINKVNLGDYEGSMLALQWYERNLKIFSNLQNMCRSDDRVLVLIGSAHLTILKEFVEADIRMERIPYMA